ncbi:MAG: hypothetical protein RBU35_11730 [Anaerolineae bacterium]|jgi:hypothetical protein|nr:hypothetical protein [Anaerolineae bacterium]
MEQVLRFIADYQWWIYAVLGLVLLFYLRRAVVSRQQGVRSIFKLEQEQMHLRYSRSVMVSAFVLLLMVGVFMLGNPLNLTPAENTPEPSPSVTNGPLTAPTLTPTSPPPTITATPTATRVPPTSVSRPTATVSAGPTATQAPQVQPPACPDPNRRITSPGMNQVVQGSVAVRGTANHPNFDYYKIEVGQGTNPQQWTVVGDLHRAPVAGGVLETFNAGAYPPGVYTLRLVVVDITGNFPEPCRVTITVQQ